MKITNNSRREEVLDEETLELLASAATGMDVSPSRLAQLRARVMKSVDEENAATEAEYITIRGDEGPWVEITPLAEKKVLNVDRLSGIESYLLRLHPGAELGGHHHDKDELCIVLEGDVSFDDIRLKAGDYHRTRAGSWHGRASSVHGALLFLQSAMETQAPAPA